MDPKLLAGSLLIFLLVTVNVARGQVDSSRVTVGMDRAVISSPEQGRWTDDSVLIRRLADTILTDARAYDNLRTLTKKVGARLSGSAGFYKAEKWGWAALEEAQADKVWMQECMVPHWVRGGKDEANWGLKEGKRAASLDIIALGNSLGSGPAGIVPPGGADR